MDQPEEGDSQSIANRILQELYPQIPIPFQRQPQNQTAREEAFTKNEIARIMQKVPIKKATGYDGIDFIVLKTIFRTNQDILITFYNKCLSLQCFPNPLKTGVIVLFLKKGKNKSDIKSYLPVCNRLCCIIQFCFFVASNNTNSPESWSCNCMKKCN
ncbi:hypothetical protein AVEN_235420-1 [Araneus ventricosus]|uniref:Reverse transcriptase domain-containing protein n=1 Tax=Araneus ventricosus TaxID=182803 RepID=A0A4Y2A4Y8_ARAVE|nr:hypothetical protein AVEN_235420-1 [Araneus ventricosus]